MATLVGTPHHEVFQQEPVILWRQRIIAIDAEDRLVMRLARFQSWNPHELVEGAAFGAAKIPGWASGHIYRICPLRPHWQAFGADLFNFNLRYDRTVTPCGSETRPWGVSLGVSFQGLGRPGQRLSCLIQTAPGLPNCV